MKDRIAYIDLASGIMILMVLYFHSLFPMWETKVLNYVPWLFFFMPWFFYKAGMMYRQKDMQAEVHNGWRKLIIPFLVWSFIGWLAHIGWHWYVGDLTPRMTFYSPLRSLVLGCSMPLNSALWFLPILYIVRLVGNWLIPRVNVGWIVVGSLALSLLFECIHIPLMPSWITKTAWGLFFFTCGYWLRDNEKKWWLIALAIIVYTISLIFPIHAVYGGVTPKWCQLAWYPSCALACVLFNNACRWLTELTEKLGTWVFPILRYVGRNAMNFYAPHYMIFVLVYNIVGYYNEGWYSGWQGLAVVTIAYAILLPAISSLDGYIQNRKNMVRM